jgi:hypothetical protein
MGVLLTLPSCGKPRTKVKSQTVPIRTNLGLNSRTQGANSGKLIGPITPLQHRPGRVSKPATEDKEKIGHSAIQYIHLLIVWFTPDSI